MRQCLRCHTGKPVSAFHKATARKDGLQIWCRECCAQRQRDTRHLRPSAASAHNKAWRRKRRTLSPKTEWARIAWNSAKWRAKRDGLPFAITRADIEALTADNCPVLGVPMVYNAGSRHPTGTSPTVDKIQNSRGYVRGNIIVVSYRANRIKNDASLAELEAVFSFYNKLE